MRLKTYSAVLVMLFFLVQCAKKKTNVIAETDEELYSKAINNSSLVFYKNDSALHISSSQSGHSAFFRIKFNNIAASVLTDNGRLPAGAKFPVGSLIVKELHGDTIAGNTFAYAVMEKLPTDPNSSAGWVWGEYLNSPASGTLVQKKGSICTGCHSASNRDYVRVFELFP